MSADVIAFPTQTAFTPGQKAILRREAASLRAMSKRNLGWADVMDLACLTTGDQPGGVVDHPRLQMEKFERA